MSDIIGLSVYVIVYDEPDYGHPVEGVYSSMDKAKQRLAELEGDGIDAEIHLHTVE